MIEILLLIFLGKRLGAMLRAKGRSAGWMQVLLVVCWFGGEFIGAAAVLVMDRIAGGTGDFDAGAYVGALLGAAGGATIVFVLAHSFARTDMQQLHAFPVVTRPPAPPI